MLEEKVAKEIAENEFNNLVSCFRSLQLKDWNEEQNLNIKGLIIDGIRYGYITLNQEGRSMSLTYELEAPIMKGDQVHTSEITIRNRISKSQFQAVKDKAKKKAKGLTKEELEELEGYSITAFMCNLDLEVFDLMTISDISKLSPLATLFLT